MSVSPTSFFGLLATFFFVASVEAGPREEALQLFAKASVAEPSAAADLAEKAYELLGGDFPKERAACAALVARARRTMAELEAAEVWFELSVSLDPGELSVGRRAEWADLCLKQGKLAKAFDVLGSPPAENPQWWQTRAKVEQATGLFEEAQYSLNKAIGSVPETEVQNRIALMIDLIGTQLRLGWNATGDEMVREVEKLLSTQEVPHPEIVSAFSLVRADIPKNSPAEKIRVLESTLSELGKSLEWSESPASLSFRVRLAEALIEGNRVAEAVSILKSLLERNVLEEPHPLLSQIYGMLAESDTAYVTPAARNSLAWLKQAAAGSADFHLGLQKTVDAVSPLMIRKEVNIEFLERVLMETQHYALQQRLGRQLQVPELPLVQYFLYHERSGKSNLLEKKYAALIFLPEKSVLVRLGSAKKIHRRVRAVIAKAERVLSRSDTGGASLDSQLTGLWKLLWEPLVPHLPEGALLIASAGLLDSVPWAILRDKDGKYLCQERPGCDVVLPWVEEKSKGWKQGGNLVCAVSTIPQRVKYPALQDELAGLRPLTGVLDEMKAIPFQTRLFNPKRTDFLTVLKAQKPSRLHMAGHSFVHGEEGFLAGFVLGGDDILFARDVADQALEFLELVVLSSCRSGIGRAEVSGNWSGLRRSFLAAGAARVMASHWKVRDDLLPSFMKSFYESGDLWALQARWISGQAKGSAFLSAEERVAAAGAWVIESRGIGKKN